MNRQAVILINWLYDFDHNSFLIGGIETYMQDLSNLLHDMNYDVTIYQLSDRKDRLRSYSENKITVNEISRYKSGRLLSFQKIFNQVYNTISKKDLFILPRETFKIKKYPSNVIILQHGVGFDFPGTELRRIFQLAPFLRDIRKMFYCMRQVWLINKCCNLVCVDYNFYNWYRTIGTIDTYKNFAVIPNYASNFITKEELNSKLSSSSHKKIVFARRLTTYRGTVVFLNAVKRLVAEFPYIEVTFAGTGQLERIVKQASTKYPSIKLTNYKASESVQFHQQFDIAVVPSLFSEGTSLSMCEAMAAGCFPIATHVGGLTNLIIDNFNGRLCYPDEDSIYEVLREVLMMDDETFNRIGRNAYNSACQSFSLLQWRKRWMKYINKHIAKTNEQSC